MVLLPACSGCRISNSDTLALPYMCSNTSLHHVNVLHKQDYLDKYYSGDVLAWFDALKHSPLTTEQPVSSTKCTF
jgi:hypothetical protein